MCQSLNTELGGDAHNRFFGVDGTQHTTVIMQNPTDTFQISTWPLSSAGHSCFHHDRTSLPSAFRSAMLSSPLSEAQGNLSLTASKSSSLLPLFLETHNTPSGACCSFLSTFSPRLISSSPIALNITQMLLTPIFLSPAQTLFLCLRLVHPTAYPDISEATRT